VPAGTVSGQQVWAGVFAQLLLAHFFAVNAR